MNALPRPTSLSTATLPPLQPGAIWAMGFMIDSALTSPRLPAWWGESST
jgi:hypothetical protein